MDGFTALMLWEEYRDNKNEKALESLLAHNANDPVNLEALMVLAYNLKLKETPFRKSHRLKSAKLAEIPFKGDRDTIMEAYYDSLEDDRFPKSRMYAELYSS